MKLLDLLRLFLRPAVDEPDPQPDPPADPPADAPDPGAELEVDLETETPPPADKSPEAEAALAEIRAEKARADAAERELRELKTRQPAAPRDEQFEHEQQVLNDPKTDPLRRWQIEADRSLRQGRTEAQFALAQAQDISDRTSFNQLAVTSPALHKRYAARVEEELVKLRSQGRNVQRETLLDLLVGRDARTGVLKKKAAPALKGDETPPAAPALNRGKLPGARSDVGGKGGSMTAKQKLEKKLEGVQI